MNAVRRVLAYGGGVVGSFGGAVVTRTSVDGRSTSTALNDAQVPHTDEGVVLPPQSREGARSLHPTFHDQFHPCESVESCVTHDPEPSPVLSRSAIAERLQQFDERPIQSEEIDTVLNSNPSSCYELVPSALRGSITSSGAVDSRMIDIGRQLLTHSPELVNMFSRSLASMIAAPDAQPLMSDSSPNFRRNSTISHDDDDYDDNVDQFSESTYASVGASLLPRDRLAAASESWGELRDKYRCSICQDVKAAPHLLVACGHSFCGGCIRHHMAVNAADSDVVCCPQCRTEIDLQHGYCYEPDFDQTILFAIESAPDSDDKVAWLERREVFLHTMRRERRQQESTPTSLWEKLMQGTWGLGIIGAVVFLLIAVAAYRAR